jgi:hypothetical protein
MKRFDIFTLNTDPKKIEPPIKTFKSAYLANNYGNHACVFAKHEQDCFIFVEAYSKTPEESALDLADLAVISHKHMISRSSFDQNRVLIIDYTMRYLARQVIVLNKQAETRATAAIFESSTKFWWMQMAGDMCFYNFVDNHLVRLAPANLTHLQADNLILKKNKIQSLQILKGNLDFGARWAILNRHLNNCFTQKQLTSIFQKFSKETDLSKICKYLIDTAKKKDGKKTLGVYLWERIS